MQGTPGTEKLAVFFSDESHMMDDLNLRQLQCPEGKHQSSVNFAVFIQQLEQLHAKLSPIWTGFANLKLSLIQAGFG